MTAVVIDVQRTDDRRDVIHRAVEALAGGNLVVFPTETVYGLAASALDAEAVDRLIQIKNRPAGQPLTLAVKSADDALDYVPDLCPLGRRLARRCWPGPVTLVFDAGHPESLLSRLPDTVRQAAVPEATVGLRVPDHPLILDVMRIMTGPLVLTSANQSGEPEAITAETAFKSLGEDVELILNEGKCQFGKPSSVVKVDRQGVAMLREGVVSQTSLKRLSNLMIVFVCTGNTCRSPIALALCKRQLATLLDCDDDELEEHGVVVASAGIAASEGGHPSREAIEILRERGIDLSKHRSQPLQAQMVRHADVILTMTQGHLDLVLAEWPEVADRASRLRENEGDVADPIGSPVEVYRQCAAQIDEALKKQIQRLDLATSIPSD